MGILLCYGYGYHANHEDILIVMDGSEGGGAEA